MKEFLYCKKRMFLFINHIRMGFLFSSFSFSFNTWTGFNYTYNPSTQRYNIMMVKRLMWAAMSNTCSYPCVVNDVLADVGMNVFVDGVDNFSDVVRTTTASSLIALGFIVSASLEGVWPFCWAAAFDCARALQTRMPSCHVWWRFVLSAPAQFLNQEPPRPQQLILPDLLMMPHVEHTELMSAVTAAGVW